MRFRIPDWLLYGAIVLLIYLNANRSAERHHTPSPPSPPELGEMLPSENPRDTTVLVELDKPSSGVGSAFAVDNKGHWLTARHVVDGCDEVALRVGRGQGVTSKVESSPDSDTAVLVTKWTREPLATDLYSTRQIGEHGFFFGFPQGKPGEAVGALLGRNRMIIRGRYETREPILTWTEIGRTQGLRGSLGGLSGGPVFDLDGEVIGLVAAESPRRGRIYTVAPKTLQSLVSKTVKTKATPIRVENYGRDADQYRRDRRIAQVVCLVRG